MNVPQDTVQQLLDEADLERRIKAAQAPVPAIGYSIVTNLGGERQMTVQCFVEQDEALEAIAAKVDKVMAVVDRQRARYTIADLKRDLATQQRTLAQAEEDFLKTDEIHEANKAAGEARLKELEDEILGIERGAHQAGRKDPVGAARARHATLKGDYKDLLASLAKAEAEKEQYRGNALVSVDRFRKAIELTTEQIAEMQALIDGG
jgi:hypothetical protein